MAQTVILRLESDGSEQVPYLSDGFPIHAAIYQLTDYPAMTCVNHWHDDVEYIWMLSGRMRYQVNGRSYLLTAGHGIAVMPCQIHGAGAVEQENAAFVCIVFPRALFGAEGGRLAHAADQSLGVPEGVPCLLLDPAQALCQPLGEQLERMGRALEEGDSSAPLALMGGACWLLYLTKKALAGETAREGQDRDLPQLKRMLGFVQTHYTQRITLAQLAAAGTLSKSACTQAFQRVLGLSPMSYVNDYRLERGMELLRDPSLSVTEVALACGFCSSSYFAELFGKRTGSTPTEFRRGRGTMGDERGDERGDAWEALPPKPTA